MSLAQERIHDFTNKTITLGIGVIAGLLTGGLIGAIVGTFFAVKYNGLPNLDGGAFLGAAISFVLAIFWAIVISPWTAKNTDFRVWAQLTATNIIACFLSAWIGYLACSTLGILGAVILSKIF